MRGKKVASRSGETGIHAAFRALWAHARVGSNPTFGTTTNTRLD